MPNCELRRCALKGCRNEFRPKREAQVLQSRLSKRRPQETQETAFNSGTGGYTEKRC